MRLFNLGDKLSDAERKRRLRGQFRHMSQLKSHIFWMDLGEAGYLDFKKRLKQKKVAKQMAADNPDLFAGISPSKAQKMISKAVEVQEKANLDAMKANNKARFIARSKSSKQPQRRSPASTKRKPYRPRSSDRRPPSRDRRHERSSSSSKYTPRKRDQSSRS